MYVKPKGTLPFEWKNSVGILSEEGVILIKNKEIFR
jgi:hypothetical protein